MTQLIFSTSMENAGTGMDKVSKNAFDTVGSKRGSVANSHVPRVEENPKSNITMGVN